MAIFYSYIIWFKQNPEFWKPVSGSGSGTKLSGSATLLLGEGGTGNSFFQIENWILLFAEIPMSFIWCSCWYRKWTTSQARFIFRYCLFLPLSASLSFNKFSLPLFLFLLFKAVDSDPVLYQTFEIFYSWKYSSQNNYLNSAF